MFLAFIFSLLTQAHAVTPTSVQVDISPLRLAAPTGILTYSEIEEMPGQVKLKNVQLIIAGTVFRPAIHISYYLDEMSGTAICQKFGFTRGSLGPALVELDINTFTMNSRGAVYAIDNLSDSVERHGTSQVICLL